MATMNASRPRLTGSLAAISALVIVFILVGLRWIWLYRHGQPLDIDESGYLSIALADYNAGLRTGFSGWLDAVLGPSVQAPLTTALASVVFWFAGPHIVGAFLVPLIAAALCIVATYYLALAVSDKTVALLSSLLISTSPVMVIYSRSFHFSMPATLVMTVALLAIVRSRHFSRVGWSLIFGLCVGLLPIARTMTIAFVPGLVAAAIYSAVTLRENLTRRLSLLFISLLLAALVSLTWLASSWRLVFAYLFSFGYGSRAVEYGKKYSIFTPDAWLQTVKYICSLELYVPHFFLAVAGMIAAIWIVAAKLRDIGLKSTLVRILGSRVILLCIVIAECLLALTSSQNKGSAFAAPFIPAAMIVTCWALTRACRVQPCRIVSMTLIVTVAVIAGVPALDLRTGLASTTSIELPLLGGVTITDGRGTIQQYLANGGFGSRKDAEPVSIDNGRAWMDLSSTTASRITALYGTQPVVAFGFRNEIYNVNTVNLQQLLHVGLPLAGRQIEPTIVGDSVEGYKLWILSDVSDACIIVTSNLTTGEFNPPVDGAKMREAVMQSDLILDSVLRAPDGGGVEIWLRKNAPQGCHRERKSNASP